MDEHAEFERLMKANQNLVVSIIARHIKDKQDLQDLVQETFLKAWRHRDRFEGRSTYSTWLVSIAIHTTQNFIKCGYNKQAKKTTNFTELTELLLSWEVLSPNTESLVIQAEQLNKIYKAIQSLPKEMANCLCLDVVMGLTYQEIATITSIPIGTVRSRLHRARNALAKMLGINAHKL